tara:strand:+ start:183 stop:839 length:657 start_codon:yes stop_codon:yes gene_type:complete
MNTTIQYNSLIRYLQEKNIITNNQDYGEFLMWDITGLINCHLNNIPEYDIRHYKQKKNIIENQYKTAKDKFYLYKRQNLIEKSGNMRNRNPYYKLKILPSHSGETLQTVIRETRPRISPANTVINEIIRQENTTPEQLIRRIRATAPPKRENPENHLMKMIKELYIKAGEKQQCSICLEDINGEDLQTTLCGHNLHLECFKQLKTVGNGKCPECRTTL